MENTRWPSADGETAACIRARDWSATVLGPIEGWPAELRTCVDLVLRNPAPAALLWGKRGILLYNDAYARLCGPRHPHILGSALEDAWPEAWDFNAGVLADCLQGRPRVARQARFALIRDGDIRDAWFDLYYGPVPDAGGAIVGVLATVIPVDAPVTDEQARQDQLLLNQTSARFHALASVTTDVIYRMSPDWDEMFQLNGRGFLKDTAVPRSLWLDEYIPEHERARVRAAIARAIGDKAMFEFEHRVLRVDGSTGWTLSRAVPMLDPDGMIQEWIGMAIDITERKRVEEKLRESDRRKDEFLAMLAHELRNPLAPIGAAAELLQRVQLDRDRMRQTSQVIGRQVAHMTGLIDDLLDVSRVTRGLIRLDLVTIDLGQVVQDAVEQVTPLVSARRHRLALDLPAHAVRVKGDHKRLVQIVTNLLNNAAKYTHEGGLIRVRVEADDDQALIEVSDNGVGMTAQTVAHAFDLFAQAERSADRTTGGLGLGLALVKSLVELHGGGVDCASPGPDEGSTFSVRLPRLADAPAAGHDGGADGAHGHSGALRILVVDDNLDAAAMLGMLLEAGGHQVLVEHDPYAGLARARDARPQVCLIDIGLPGMDGNQLAQRLRALPECAGALLVAVTGYGQDSDRARTLAAGFDAHLVKPLDIAALYALLERAQRPA